MQTELILREGKTNDKSENRKEAYQVIDGILISKLKNPGY